MTRTSRLPSHEDMVTAILATAAQASQAQEERGCAWYASARRIVDGIADEAGRPRERVALALAALSPRNPWTWNVADAYAFATADPAGPVPSATTFTSNREAAWRALRDGDPWTGVAPKVRAFVRAILGDPEAVVVDVWAMRVATSGARDAVTRGEYAAVADAYREASRRLGGICPRDLQAVTWIVAQDAGLGSNRRGRMDRTVKSSALPGAVALLRREGAIA